MKRHTGGRTIDGISVLVDGEPLLPHADQLKLTDYGSNGAPSQLAFAILFEHLGNAAEAKSLCPSFMQRIVANFEQRGK